VGEVVNWARRTGVRLAVRSGGHSYAGYSTTTGLVVDLRRLHGIAFQRGTATATIGAGARLIDVEAALAARSYEGDTQVVVELTDAFLPENAGRWRLGAHGAERTNAAAELTLDITGLGSVYLGGFSFADLVRASRAVELVPGAVVRADALFVTHVQPWCMEIF
jgi:predicted acetyltransferase